MAIAAPTITYQPVPELLGVSPHGILAAIGVLTGWLFLMREVRRRDLPTELVERALLWGIPAGIVGARLDFVISHPGSFDSVGQMLRLWEGGLALFGGLIAGSAATLIVLYRGGADLLRSLDAAAPGIALAIAIGRVGDLLLTDHLGKPIGAGGFGLAYEIKAGYDLAPGFLPSPAVPPPVGASCADTGMFYAGCSYHLTPAYDLVGAALLFILLVLLRRHVAYPAGFAISLWAAWYGAQRLGLDFTRGADERPLAGLTGTQLLAIVLLLAAVCSLVRLLLRSTRNGGKQAGPSSRQGSMLRRDSETGDPDDHPTPAVRDARP